VLESSSVRIQRLAEPRAIGTGASTCLLALLFLGAVVHVAGALSDHDELFLDAPLDMVSVPLAVMALFCLGASGMLWAAALLAPRRPGRLWVDGALHVDCEGQRASFPLACVTSAHLSLDEGALYLRTYYGNVIEARVTSVEEARALVHAVATGEVGGTFSAQLAPTCAEEPWWAASPPLAGVVLTSLVAISACAFMSQGVALSLGLAVGIGAMAWGGGRSAAVGRDGVLAGGDGLVVRQNGRTRFIPYRCVSGVRSMGSGIGVSLLGGEAVELPMLTPEHRRRAGALGQTLAERRRAHLAFLIATALVRRPPKAGVMAVELARRGRSIPEWRAALAALVSDAAAGYRRASLSRADVEEVLEYTRAPLELRLGAALALAEGASEATRTRLRVVASSCVHPAARAALTRVSEGALDDETLSRAQAAAEMEEEQLRARVI
jgi:hypothetical protein